MFETALRARSAQRLPLEVRVDDRAVVSVEFAGDTLDLATARILAAIATPSWAAGLRLQLNRVTSLAPAVARELASLTAPGQTFSLHIELNGLATISDEAAEALAMWTGMAPGAARHIEWDYYEPTSSLQLELNGLTSLTAPAARALIDRWQHTPLRSATRLALNGVTAIADDGLVYLEADRGTLHLELGGITQLSTAVATQLSRVASDRLDLPSVSRLGPSAATALAAWSGADLRLGGLTSLPATSAAPLSRFRGRALRLDGLASLDASAAIALATFGGRELSLGGLRQIDERTANALVAWNRRDRAREKAVEKALREEDALGHRPDEDAPPAPLEERIASAIAALYHRDLHLGGLGSPAPAVAAALARWTGPRKLWPVRAAAQEDLDVDIDDGCNLERVTAAEIIATVQRARRNALADQEPVLEAFASWHPIRPSRLRPGELSLADEFALDAMAAPDEPALTIDADLAITPPLIALLNTRDPGDLRINKTSIGVADAAALAAWNGHRLHLDELTALPSEIAIALGPWEGDTLSINGIRALGGGAARALAALKIRKIDLDGVRQLTPAAAAALAGFAGTNLELDGVTTLSGPVARELARWRGSKLELDGLTRLDTAAAQSLAAWPGKTLELDGLRLLSAGALKALLAAKASITIDGMPLSLSTSTAGVAVPERLQPQTAQLMGRPGWYKVLDGDSVRIVAKTLSPTQARAVAKLTGIATVELPMTTELDAASARALAALTASELSLDALTSLDPETARALSTWKGAGLSLKGLRRIDAKTTRALVAWGGQSLDLRTLERVDAQTAAALLAFRGALIDLGPLTLVPRSAAAKMRDRKSVIGTALLESPEEAALTRPMVEIDLR